MITKINTETLKLVIKFCDECGFSYEYNENYFFVEGEENEKILKAFVLVLQGV